MTSTLFDITYITFDNFRSFVGTHKLAIPKAPGLYLITGENKSEPRLGRNGAGKSTILEAIYWCLYGATTRGLRAGDVVTRGAKQTRVTVALNVAEGHYKIERTQNPNTLTVDGVVKSQDEVNKLLRIGPQAFTYAVMTPQFGEAFFDLKPAEKLSLFSQIMELDYWLECSEMAKRLSDDIAIVGSKTSVALEKTQEMVKKYEADLAYLNDRKVGGFLAEVAAKVKELEKVSLGLQDKIEKDKEARNFAVKAKVNAQVKLSKLNLPACPKCGRTIEDEKLNKDLAALRRNVREWEEKIADLEFDIRVNEKENLRTWDRIREENSRTNPYTSMIKATQKNIQDAKDQTIELTLMQEADQKQWAAMNYWVTGFKRLRLFIIEDTLRHLELEVNNNMIDLGLTNWRVEFDVERENKKGGVTKGFTVLVYPPGVKEPVKYESWSGGEVQRLRLAGDLGLANLIMERAGLQGAIEFFDEPSRHLDEQGLVDVAELLHRRALEQNKRIFLVDHNSIDFGDFLGTVFVTKDVTGSSIRIL